MNKIAPGSVWPEAEWQRGGAMEIDMRGLEPPMPMVQILEATEELPEGVVLLARTDRRPEFLLLELPNRGFSGESTQQPDGSYITHIQRA